MRYSFISCPKFINQAVHPPLIGLSKGSKHTPIGRAPFSHRVIQGFQTHPSAPRFVRSQRNKTNKQMNLIYRREMSICGIYTNHIYDTHHQQIGNLQVIPLIIHCHCHRPFEMAMAPSAPFQQLCDPRVT
jgi:hypothetical protein